MSGFDNKLTALPEATSLEDTDLLYAVTGPGATPASKKITGANARKTPSRVLFVDGRYSANVTPFFDNISDAMTAANSLSPSSSNPVTIRAFSNSDGSPVDFDGNDYYTNRENGIIFESSYDPVAQLIKGGKLVTGNLLYTLKTGELTMNLRF